MNRIQLCQPESLSVSKKNKIDTGIVERSDKTYKRILSLCMIGDFDSLARMARNAGPARCVLTMLPHVVKESPVYTDAHAVAWVCRRIGLTLGGLPFEMIPIGWFSIELMSSPAVVIRVLNAALPGAPGDPPRILEAACEAARNQWMFWGPSAEREVKQLMTCLAELIREWPGPPPPFVLPTWGEYRDRSHIEWLTQMTRARRRSDGECPIPLVEWVTPLSEMILHGGGQLSCAVAELIGECVSFRELNNETITFWGKAIYESLGDLETAPFEDKAAACRGMALLGVLPDWIDPRSSESGGHDLEAVWHL